MGKAKRMIFGVGYNSGGVYVTKEFGKNTYGYSAWYDMMRRCYSEKHQANNPTYIGCTVDVEWHDFQVFAKWLANQKLKSNGYHLDKDLLVNGNKIYSKDTCSLVPMEINLLLNSCSKRRGDYPVGVRLHKHKGSFEAQISINGKHRSLGYYKNTDEAHDAYVIAKEQYVKDKALEWKPYMDRKVFNALMNWRVERDK